MGRIASALVVLVLAASAAKAADFDQGMAAARAGDFATAYAEWKPLADAGNVRAQLNLADMYATGMGVDVDLGEAARLYRAAADVGNPLGQFKLAMALQAGEGVPRDRAAAMALLVRAAEQRLPQAMYEIGYAYHEGEGVAVDLVEAMKWFIIADEYGAAHAYAAGTYTADALTEQEFDAAIAGAKAWLTEHPR